MGTRYYIDVECPDCGYENEAYYAPTCGFTDYVCVCGKEGQFVQGIYLEWKDGKEN